MSEPTMTVSLPRRKMWGVLWLLFTETLRAYWYRSSSVDFTIGEEATRD